MLYTIRLLIIILYNMETATIIVIFVSSLLLGSTTYSIYTAFGPTSKNLRDPFEEHED
jgi:PsbN protein